ncbi:MAG: phosphatase PAP2 family protein [Pseudomonadota bacterium]
MSAAALPTKPALRLYLAMYLGLHALFAVVYGGANWLAARHANPMHYYAAWEREVAFVPMMIYPYMSIALLFWAPLFLLDESRMRRLGLAATVCMLVAGLCFVFAPGIYAFAIAPAMPPAGTLEASLFAAMRTLDQPYNTAPSLHVALSTLFVLAVRTGKLSALFFVWLGAIIVSVLLVHQHHLFDVFTGALLGAGCYAAFCRDSART